MVLFKFGNFDWACREVPSFPACNLFFRQLLVHPKGLAAPATDLLGLPTDAAEIQSTLQTLGVGVRPSCYIPRMHAVGGQNGSLGNVANIAVCGLSVLIGIALCVMAGRRTAAVARKEMQVFLLMFCLVQGAQLADTGALLKVGSTALTWISGVHLGLLVGLFWVLAWLAFLSLQIVEDGTLLSIVPMLIGTIVLSVGSGYIALDTGFTVTNYFRSDPPQDLHSIWLFVLTIIWPAAAAGFYFLVQFGVVVRVLREKKPLFLFTMAAGAFILSQGAYFALSHKICMGTKAKVDGSFVASLLELISIVFIFAGWKSITEDSWEVGACFGGAPVHGVGKLT
ncbi:BQ5605_C003g02067 [Microbotryum silenes-dioicae]|uniref:BQ5605_C003g02067 protein n=1 Tax=Microbotryum silenes-dioicae TaxID=796604 RepID=A0A2X0MMN7_9BASI|nr:BQ5605_C003g02067 [Microbotryum silenes-dioicae]